MKSPDTICEKYSKESKNIDLKIFVEDDTVFIEGDKLTLEFLSELIKAQSSFEKDDGFQISPNGAGKIFFKNNAKYGVYIHKKEKTGSLRQEANVNRP